MGTTDQESRSSNQVVVSPGSSEQRSATGADRSLLIDIVKGLAISLVALGHTNQGELVRNWWGTSLLGVHLNAFIYSFHMPAFFFVSGVLLPRGVQKRGMRGFTTQKVRTLLYPFVLWSIAMPLITAVLALFMSIRHLDLHAILLNLVTGNSAWFLPALFVSLILGAWLRRVPALPMFLLACLAALFWRPVNILAIDRGIWHLPFVIAGIHLREPLKRLEQVPALLSLVIAAVMTAVLYGTVCQVSSETVIHWALLPAGFWGTCLLLFLGRSLLRVRAGKLIAWVGLASFWIFLLSPFPQGTVRSLLLFAHCTSPLLQLVLPTLAAIAVPAWIYHRRDRFHIGWLFIWPVDNATSVPAQSK